MADYDHDISLLNSLIATTLDSVEGYRESAKDAHNTQLETEFTARASERTTVVTMLREQVAALGGNAEDDGTLLGGAHRMFVNLKSTLMGRQDEAILKEIERGETYLMNKYQEALDDRRASPATLAVIERAHAQVASGYDKMLVMTSGRVDY